MDRVVFGSAPMAAHSAAVDMAKADSRLWGSKSPQTAVEAVDPIAD